MKLKDFELKKVKALNDGGIEVKFEKAIKEGDSMHYVDATEKCTMEIHPDLSNVLSSFKPALAHVFMLTTFRHVGLAEDFSANENQKDLIEKSYKEILSNIRVSSITISGQDENRGCVVSGVLTSESNQKMSMSTHFIKFSHNTYGFEEDLEEFTETLNKEVFSYLYSGKRAQGDLFNDSLNNTEDEETEGLTDTNE